MHRGHIPSSHACHLHVFLCLCWEQGHTPCPGLSMIVQGLDLCGSAAHVWCGAFSMTKKKDRFVIWKETLKVHDWVYCLPSFCLLSSCFSSPVLWKNFLHPGIASAKCYKCNITINLLYIILCLDLDTDLMYLE